MGDAHGRIRGIHALAAGAGRAIRINAQVGLVDMDVDLVRLGKHRDRRRRSLDAALALGLGNALHAVHAALVLHDGVDLIARNLELDRLEAARVARARIKHLELPTLRLAEALVHLEEVARKNGRLVAASSRANLHDGILLVVRVARDEHELDVFLKLRKLSLVGGDVLLEHGLLVRVRGLALHFLGSLDIVERAQVLPSSGNELRLVRMLLGQTHVFLLICHNRRVRELLFELLIGSDEFFELVAHDGSFAFWKWTPENDIQGAGPYRRAPQRLRHAVNHEPS